MKIGQGNEGLKQHEMMICTFLWICDIPLMCNVSQRYGGWKQPGSYYAVTCGSLAQTYTNNSQVFTVQHVSGMNRDLQGQK